MSTFFKGFGDLYKPVRTGPIDNLQQQKVFPGHVLEICLDESSPLYESERDIGKIRFRDLVTEYNVEEASLVKVAYPLDRSIARYPFPGEEVVIYRAMGETRSASALALANVFFYSFVVSTHHNITYNQNPFIGTDVYSIDKTNPLPAYDTAKRRFEKKTIDINTVRDSSDKTKVYKQLRPQEGDFILQGRFGNSIRLGSTSTRSQNPASWSDEQSSGVSGDGIMVLRVDRDYSVEERSMLINEDVNQDDASVYLCSSQKIQLNLACTKKMKSWAARYGLPDVGSQEAAGIVSTSTDTSELWQKVIDSTKPVNESFKKLDNTGTPESPDLPINQ